MTSRPAPEAQAHADATELQGEPARAWISMLVDGEVAAADSRGAAGPSALDRALGAWREDDDARQAWHRYHLIGDVMRSEDLASTAARDNAFVLRLRERLAAEPVVVAPAPVQAAVAAPVRRQPWLLPLAAAAGFVVVAGVLVVARMQTAASDGTAAPALAVAPAADGNSRLVAAPPNAQQVMLTDPRVEELLRAHQAAGGGINAAAPGTGIRRVEFVPAAAAGR